MHTVTHPAMSLTMHQTLTTPTRSPNPTHFHPELARQWQQTATQEQQVAWLIQAFDLCFGAQGVVLVRSEQATTHSEPEYLPRKAGEPAKICFAHGFFASALHEVAHWCIAGKHRRTLPDFGYWYVPDGRDTTQQAAFEKVEVKPQAIEWLFTLACGKRFFISQDNLSSPDNLNGKPALSEEQHADSFKQCVYQQAQRYLLKQDKLPNDARRWLAFLQTHIRPNKPVLIGELDVGSI